MIAPSGYNRVEQLAAQQLPNRLVQDCYPVTFNRIGYPTRVDDYMELWRYADVMHECRFESDFKELLGSGLTEREWQLWKQISSAVYNKTQFMTPIVPRGALARATVMYRAIMSLAKVPTIVVEIGPGSGYLSAMLALSDTGVISVENTQAFYLWQSMLFSALPIRVDELTDFDKPMTHKNIYHVPWWNFYKLDPAHVHGLVVDLVTANHCLSEMTRGSATYIANCCRAWNSPLLFEGIGLQHDQSPDLTGVFNGVTVREIVEPPSAYPLTVFSDEIIAFQTDLLRQADLRTPDEKWLNGLYGEDYYS